MALQHFLLVYDLNAQHLIEQRQFDDGAEAAAYTALEQANQGRDDLEIVLVGANNSRLVAPAARSSSARASSSRSSSSSGGTGSL